MCIWLRNCEFYLRSFASKSFLIRAARIRIRLQIRQKVSDPTGSGSDSGFASTTLFYLYCNLSEVFIFLTFLPNTVRSSKIWITTFSGYRYLLSSWHLQKTVNMLRWWFIRAKQLNIEPSFTGRLSHTKVGRLLDTCSKLSTPYSREQLLSWKKLL